MSPPDPDRLAGTRSPLGDLFSAAKQELPSQQQLTELARGLGPLLDAPAAASAAAKGSLLIKVGAVASVAALVVGGATFARRSRSVTPDKAPIARSTPRISQSVASPALPDTVVTTPEPVSAALPSAVPPSAVPKSGRAPIPLGSAVAGPSEPALLEQARRALGSSPSAALALTNQHAARFPHGVLTQEREVIAIEALRRLHRTSEASQRAAAFAKAFPGSAHQRMVEEAPPK